MYFSKFCFCKKITLPFFLFFFSFSLSALEETGESKICLNMIVKNEAKIIERCLDSVKDVVDFISICDTGSSDNTVQVIESYLKKNHIPGVVHHHQWRNFGYNRTLSVESAKKALEEASLPLESTYLLLLDADMVLNGNPAFSKKMLKDDLYYMMQKSCEHTYYNIRLIRASLPWQCKGVTHEYWEATEKMKSKKLNLITIDDRGDGGCKSDKFERDIRLLTDGLKEEPENGRYMFYLAQSYHAVEKYEDAIKWYLARIEKEGWKEEVWYSRYMIGECFESLERWGEAFFWYLSAFEENPERAEPLYNIARYFRENDKYNLSHLFAKYGSQIPFPKNQVLFISHPVYDYQFDEELSISSYYTPSFKKDGLEATDRLLTKKEIPDDVMDLACRNAKYYIDRLDGMRLQSLKPFSHQFISFQTTEDGYEALCKKDENYLLCQYDKNFQVLEEKEINQGTSGFSKTMSLQGNPDFLKNVSFDVSRFHLESAPVSWNNGILLLVKEVFSNREDEEDFFAHRLLFLDQNSNLKSISKPFSFLNGGKQSCSGMMWDLSHERLLFPFSANDRLALLGILSSDDLTKLLKQVSS